MNCISAITLGARAVEKHFTDDTKRSGPDHPFSMDPNTWRQMVNSARKLEKALGNGIKSVESNELKTVILQRRATRVIKNIYRGQTLSLKDIEFQRPCPLNAITPNNSKNFLEKVKRNIKSGDYLRITD